jgi:hypothetical protein
LSASADAGLRRALTSVGMHLVSFVVVGTILGFPWKIMAFWGVGLAIHLARTVPGIARELRGGPEAVAHPAAMRGARPAAAVSHSTDPYLRDLERNVQSLRQAAAEAGGAGDLDLDGVEEAARTVHERRMRLADLVEPSVRTRLERELAEARRRVESTTDARGAEVYEAEVQAISTRLDAMDDAAGVSDRLQARERTILHEIDAARLALARTGVPAATSETLGLHAQKLRGELEAEAEIEERLAQARRAHRARET